MLFRTDSINRARCLLAGFVHAEMVPDLMQNSIPDLDADFFLASTDSFDISLVEIDDVRHVDGHNRTIGERYSVIEAEEQLARQALKLALYLETGQFLHDYLDIVEVLSELRRKAVKCFRDQFAEALHRHSHFGRTRLLQGRRLENYWPAFSRRISAVTALKLFQAVSFPSSEPR